MIFQPRLHTVQSDRAAHLISHALLHMQNPYKPHDSWTVLCFDPLMQLHFSHFPTEGGCNSVVRPVPSFYCTGLVLCFVMTFCMGLSSSVSSVLHPSSPCWSTVCHLSVFSQLHNGYIFINAYCAWKWNFNVLQTKKWNTVQGSIQLDPCGSSLSYMSCL